MRLIDADSQPTISIDVGKIGYKKIPYKLLVGMLEIIKQGLSCYETVDAEPVVRCKDCKYGDIGTTEDGKKVVFECWHGSTYACKDADWFCADGERKDDAKND